MSSTLHSTTMINYFSVSITLMCLVTVVFLFLKNSEEQIPKSHQDEPCQNDCIFEIPLVHTKSALEILLEKGEDLKIIEQLYNAAKPKRQKRFGSAPPAENDTLPLYKYFDTQYYGIVNVGKPGKAFKMFMDTTWGYSWIVSKFCPRTEIQCAVHTAYNHDESSTYIADGASFNLTEYIGFMSKDVFLVGQMKASNQSFAEVTVLPFTYAIYTADGTVGLGQVGLAPPKYRPFFYNFFQQNKLKLPIFSFYVNRDPTTPRGGSIFFGGIDNKHNKTAFTTVKISSNDYFLFRMDKVTVEVSKKKRVDFCRNSCTALADTSSNTIVGPAEEVKEINQLIGAERIFFSDRYLIPCVNEYKGPKVDFVINNTTFRIFARDYIQKLSYSGFTICLSAFQPSSDQKMWTLGGAFLYQFYTAYNPVKREMYIAEAA